MASSATVGASPHLASQDSSASIDEPLLIFPYYTVNAGNDTLLSITNDTGGAKGLKWRIREGLNGRMVAELNRYPGPYDSWTAALFARGQAEHECRSP